MAAISFLSELSVKPTSLLRVPDWFSAPLADNFTYIEDQFCSEYFMLIHNILKV